MRVFLTFALLFVLAALWGTPRTAMAQDTDSLYRYDDGSGTQDLLLSGKKTLSDDPEYWSNLYYQNCLGANSNETSREYNTLFCACSSAAMMGELSITEMQALFVEENTARTTSARKKLHILGATPCFLDIVHDYSFNECAGTLLNPQEITDRRKAICECRAQSTYKDVSDYVDPEQSRGENYSENLFEQTIQSAWWFNHSQIVARGCSRAYKYSTIKQ